MYYITTNFTWSVDYECDYSHCVCTDSICRCTKIVNTKILDCDVSIENITIKIEGRRRNYKPSIIEQYCMDRLLHIHNAFSTYNYEVDITGGYYGEQVGGIYFMNNNKLIEDIKLLLDIKKDIDKIKFILEKEYSYLLPEIELTNAIEIVNVSVDKLFKNTKHTEMIKRNNDYPENDWSLPQGIMIEDRLVDGHHRLENAIVEKKKELSYIKLKVKK